MFYVLNLLSYMNNRVRDAKDRGATATEYAMLVAFIAVAIVICVTFFGHALADFFGGLGKSIGITSGTANHSTTTVN